MINKMKKNLNQSSMLLFYLHELRRGRTVDLIDVGGLDVRLSAVGDAILQHLLYTGHQEDVCVGVGHREDALEEKPGFNFMRARKW